MICPILINEIVGSLAIKYPLISKTLDCFGVEQIYCNISVLFSCGKEINRLTVLIFLKNQLGMAGHNNG